MHAHLRAGAVRSRGGDRRASVRHLVREAASPPLGRLPDPRGPASRPVDPDHGQVRVRARQQGVERELGQQGHGVRRERGHIVNHGHVHQPGRGDRRGDRVPRRADRHHSRVDVHLAET